MYCVCVCVYYSSLVCMLMCKGWRLISDALLKSCPHSELRKDLSLRPKNSCIWVVSQASLLCESPVSASKVLGLQKSTTLA